MSPLPFLTLHLSAIVQFALFLHYRFPYVAQSRALFNSLTGPLLFFTLSGFACWWFLCWCILCLTYACIVDRRLNALEELIFSHWTLGAAHFTYSLSTDSLSTDLRRLTCTQRLLRSTYVFYGGAINFFFESSSPFRVVAGVAWLVLLGRQALGVGMCQRNTGRPRVTAM